MDAPNPFLAPEIASIQNPVLCPVCQQKLRCTFIWRFTTTFRFRCVRCRSKLVAYAPELVFVGISSVVVEFALLWALQYFAAQRFGFSVLTSAVAGGLGGAILSFVEEWFARYVLAFATVTPANAPRPDREASSV